jgi:hypothetical protein
MSAYSDPHYLGMQMEDSPHLLAGHRPLFLLGSQLSGTAFLSSVLAGTEGWKEKSAKNGEREGERVFQYTGKEQDETFRKEMRRIYGSSVGFHRCLLKDGGISEFEIEYFAGWVLQKLDYL